MNVRRRSLYHIPRVTLAHLTYMPHMNNVADVQRRQDLPKEQFHVQDTVVPRLTSIHRHSKRGITNQYNTIRSGNLTPLFGRWDLVFQ
jgi:hypothetical protein